MASIWTTAITAILFLYLLLKQLKKKNKNRKLPPGPTGLPIIGHFHLLSRQPYRDLYHLARKHGPIMSIRLGSIPTVVISSPAAAELFLKTHDLNFANRADHEASYHLHYEMRDIIFAKYGDYWRNMRKLCTLELLSNLKISQFRAVRRAELGLLVGSLKRASEARECVDMSVRIMSLTADIMCVMVFGRKFEDGALGDQGFKQVMKETMEEAGTLHLGDYFPYLKWLDLQGSVRRCKKLSKRFDGFLERIIDDHQNQNQNQSQSQKKRTVDFVDTLMGIMESGEAGFDFDRRHVKAVLLDMLLAGMDTSAAAIEWTLSELIKNPTTTKKLQNELAQVVGLDGMVDESHLSDLKYLDCVIKESMRVHPPGPLSTHESMEDCEVEGFNIPKKTLLLVNIWAIGRDPSAWTDPEKFLPDRFIGSNVDLRGRDYALIPFGTGRRGCPGLQLGLTMVQLVVAQLLHCFHWELPHGLLPNELDMSEDFGLVAARANHLMLIPTYRLNK